MLANETVRQIAANLHQAERDRAQIRQVSRDHPEITDDDAYAVQSA